ncbi:MAG: exodeoxyribonuclease V subunit alpha, partial [Chitinophagia bacterium]|nr:exodeoxyribonuclease V subunit alpha [Chitinophagia bacterium]
YSHRFNSRSDIGKFSDAVLHNRIEVMETFLKQEDGKNVQIVSSDTDSALLEFIDGFEEFILENDIASALNKLQQLRILCAVREGKGGLYDCNQMAESRLKKNGVIQPDSQFYENRPIMITRNNYELGLVNGDIGIVRTVQGEKKLWLDAGNGTVRGINTNYIQEAETVFAMTIHKSQGSEYNRVFIRLPNQSDIPILTRELLYTAVTRAKQIAIIQTTEAVLKATAAGSVKRASGITNRMDEI